MAIAIAMGLLMAVLRVFGPRFISWLGVAFIEVIRGTPLLIQLFIIFYGLPVDRHSFFAVMGCGYRAGHQLCGL